MVEITPVQLAGTAPTQIVSTTAGRAFPELTQQLLFNFPDTAAYINLASAKQLVANTISRQGHPNGELPSMGSISISGIVHLLTDDIYPPDFDYTLCIK